MAQSIATGVLAGAISLVALVGCGGQRVIGGSDIPGAQIPDHNMEDEVVWRNAETGEEIARSDRLPAITSGTMVQPDYSGDMLYPGVGRGALQAGTGSRRISMRSGGSPTVWT